MDRTDRQFPPGFVWGVATSAYQIEGAVTEDGRLPSIWDTFSRVPGKVAGGDTGDVATDHYHRLDSDVALMAELGIAAYRFSVAWPRIIPTGSGAVNRKGLDFYSRLVDRLLLAGIRPFLTLYHWDLPQPLQDRGGWTSRDTASRFAEYAAVVARELGDRVDSWITLNEPWCSAMLGYDTGVHAPGIRDRKAAFTAAHHLLLAHGLGVESLRASLPASVLVGVTLNMAPFRALTDGPEDRAAARQGDGTMNRLFLEPLFRARYPADVVAETRPAIDWDFVQDADLRVIGTPLDFLGINYYRPETVSADPSAAPGSLPYPGTTQVFSQPMAELPHTIIDWPIQPSGMTEVLTRVSRDYTDMPLYITENGAAFEDVFGPTGTIEDEERIDYLRGHIAAVAEAISLGVDVRGYFAWTLVDNFEWSLGYAPRFGLVAVRADILQRVPKASAKWYRDVIRMNGLAQPGAAAGAPRRRGSPRSLRR